MKLPYTFIYPSCFIFACAVSAIDDFHIQASKIAHEETSWRHDIYTAGHSSELLTPDVEWLRKPAVTLRLSAGHHERSLLLLTPGGPESMASESDVWTPMLSGSFESIGGINVGFTYAHTIHRLESIFLVPGFGKVTVDTDGHLDSVGGYVSKQWEGGLRLAGTWSYTWTDGERFFLRDFDTVAGSGGVGFARSFGEKKFGRNLFVDASANLFYEDDSDAKESWYSVLLAKLGHSFCPSFAVYGLFNLFDPIDSDARGFDFNTRDYHPAMDATWGEAGGGLQAQLGSGVALTAEATAPVLDDEFTAEDAFQIRGALNWRF